MQGLDILVIDQRDIQKRGGKCARFPVSCLIRDMLRELGLESKVRMVLDTTYGEGRFYGAWRPKLLLASDIKIHKWVVEPDWFTISPSWSVWHRVQKLGIRPDLVVIDPPFMERGGKGSRKHYEVTTAFGSPETIIDGGLESAKRLGCKTVLVHYNKLYVPNHWELVKYVEFLFFTRYLKQDTKYNPNTSYFYILKKVNE